MKRSLSVALLLAVLPAFLCAVGLPRVLFVADDDGRLDISNNKPYRTYISDGLGHMGMSYTLWSVPDSTRRPDTTVLNAYDLVIWDQPDLYSFVSTPLTTDDSVAIGAYLLQGGKLWLNAPDIGLNYIWAGAPECPSWLHISSYRSDGSNESIAIDSIIGVPGDSLGDGLAINTDVGVHIEGEYSDRLRPAAGAVGCFTGPAGDPAWNHGDSIFYCAVRFDSVETGQQLFYLSTAFQGIPLETDRDTLMARVLGWFGWSPYNSSDAQVNRIKSPGSIVAANAAVLVEIEVSTANVNRLNNVWVHAVAESLPGYAVYSDSIMIDSIMPNVPVTASLPAWNTAGADTMRLVAWVNLPGDINTANDTITQTVSILPVIYQTDFEAGPGRWIGDWAVTTEGANSGTHCITDWPYHNYGINSDRFVCLDTLFDLTLYSTITLSFANCHWIEPGHDFGYVMVSPDGGTQWDSVASYTGIDTAWHFDAVNLNGYNASNAFMFGFRMGSDALLNMKGWLIDDVVLTASAAKARGVEDAAAVPGMVSALTQIAPNPSNGSATIRFQVATSKSRIVLRVYNLAGQLVRTVYDGTMAAGVHQLRFDGTGNGGAAVASGVYFVRLAVGDFTATKRLTVLR